MLTSDTSCSGAHSLRSKRELTHDGAGVPHCVAQKLKVQSSCHSQKHLKLVQELFKKVR